FHPAGDLLRVRDRRDHRGGRCVERLDRGRGGQLRVAPSEGRRAGRLHRAGRHGRGLPEGAGRGGGDERVRGRAQPAGLAAAVPPGGNEVLDVTTPGPVILEAKGVYKAFTTPDGRALPVLDGVSLTLREGEIVALLGKSGSGKSTFLRCIAGLIAPSAGTATYR